MTKNAIRKNWNKPIVGGRRYSDPANQPTAPTAPTISAGTLTTSTFPITISGGSGATSWIAQIKESVSSTWLTDGTLSVGATSYTYSGLTSDTSYDVRIRVTNTIGSANSNILSDTTDVDEGGGGSNYNVITINGSGFGTKSTVAPLFYPNWTGLSQGDDWADAGWDVMGGNRGSDVTYSQIRTDVSVYGMPTWRTRVEPGVGETFTHFGKNLPGTGGVTCMYLRRGDYISNTGGSSGDGQIKGTRIGYSGFTGAGEGGDQYGTRNGQFGSSHFVGDGATAVNDGCFVAEHYWDADISGGEEQTIYTNDEGVSSWPAAGNGSWHAYYDYVEMGTSQGASNSKHHFRVDNTWMIQRNNLPVYNAGGLTYCQPTPGYANGFADNGTTWNWYHSFVYIDNSRAFAVLGNASTWDACTLWLPIYLETWNNTQVTGHLFGLDIPSGFDWAYVTTEAGTTNSSGMDYTVSSPGVFFEPDFDDFSTVNSMFDSWNTVGTVSVGFSTDHALPGQTKSIKISYGADEDEWTGSIDLLDRGVSTGQSTTLYTRKYIYFDSLWETHWPVGLKTSRYFTDRNASANYAYMSEKYIWQRYPPPTDVGSPGDQYGWGLNHACFNNDRVQQYTSGMLFGNGLPYIRAGRFYCFETFLQMNSADNVADGILQCRIDGVVVKNDTNVAFRASDRDDGEGNAPANGTHWQSFWFGGNISVATNNNFPSGQRLDRYEAGHYASTTADWLSF